jgi:hypothetical protein
MRKEKRPPSAAAPADLAARPAPRRKRYEPPRVVDYGRVSKLTQTGGVTTKDTGSMRQVCL